MSAEDTERDGPPPCGCDKRVPAGALTMELKPEHKNVVVVTMHGVESCFTQDVDARWWHAFLRTYYKPAQEEREMANRLLAAVLGQIGRVRLHAPMAMAKAAQTQFQVVVDDSKPPFLELSTPDAPMIVPARTMPPLKPV